MAENKMKEVAKLLGVELGEKFNSNFTKMNPCYLSEGGLYNCHGVSMNDYLGFLLLGKYEIKRPILDNVEKRYLEGVLKPFKNRISYIKKHHDIYHESAEFIYMKFKNNESLIFPYFKLGTMYKGMEPNKEYTLQELGLFKNNAN